MLKNIFILYFYFLFYFFISVGTNNAILINNYCILNFTVAVSSAVDWCAMNKNCEFLGKIEPFIVNVIITIKHFDKDYTRIIYEYT